MKEKLLNGVHLLIILVVYTAFTWADWRFLLLGVLVYWLQIIIFKACIISIAQYNNKETSFVGLYINKLLNILSLKELPMKKIRFFLDWILPIIFLSLAYILQHYLGIVPRVSFWF